jgi:hypothetical protein
VLDDEERDAVAVDLPEQLHRALDSVGFRPAMTSSRRSSSGSIASALASSSRFKSGIVKVRRGVGDPVPETDPRQDSSARSRACAAVRSFPAAPNIAPMATLSRTERAASTA